MSHMPQKTQAAKDIGRIGFTLLDGGEQAVIHDTARYDLFVGRLVAGSSVAVEILSDDLRPSRVVTTFGQFFVPYTPVRGLVGTLNAPKIIASTLKTVYSPYPRPLNITLSNALVSMGNNGNEYGVSMKVSGDMWSAQKEALRASQSFAHATDRNFIHPGPLKSLLIYNTTNEYEAHYAAEILNNLGEVHTVLTMPLICGMPKVELSAEI